MSRPVSLRRLAAAALLLAALAGAGLHHHEDLSGALSVASAGEARDRVVSSHSPLSKTAHWHSGVRVKDDPCLACQSHRMAGLAADARPETPLTIVLGAAAVLAFAPISVTESFHGCRAPPSQL